MSISTTAAPVGKVAWRSLTRRWCIINKINETVVLHSSQPQGSEVLVQSPFLHDRLVKTTIHAYKHAR